MSSTPTPSIAPWLAVGDATRAVDYYRAAFGAVEIYRLAGDDGTIDVAQLSIGGAVFWVQKDADASPAGRAAGSIRLILSVDDPDSAFERVSQPGPPSKPRSTKSTGGEPGGSPIRSATTGR